MGLEDRQIEHVGHLIRPAARGRGRRRRLGSGRLGEGHLARQALPGLVGPQHVLQRDHVRGRLDPLQVQIPDPVDVLEDPDSSPTIVSTSSSERRRRASLRHVQYLLPLDHRRGDSRWRRGHPSVDHRDRTTGCSASYCPRDAGTRGREIRRLQPAPARASASPSSASSSSPSPAASSTSSPTSANGSATTHRAPHTQEYLWLALAFAYMVVITGICLVAQADVVRYRPLLLVLAAGKTASSLGSLAFFADPGTGLHLPAELPRRRLPGAAGALALGRWRAGSAAPSTPVDSARQGSRPLSNAP